MLSLALALLYLELTFVPGQAESRIDKMCELFGGRHRDRFVSVVSYHVGREFDYQQSLLLQSGQSILLMRRFQLLNIGVNLEGYDQSTEHEMEITLPDMENVQLPTHFSNVASLDTTLFFILQGDVTRHKRDEAILCFYQHQKLNFTCLLNWNTRNQTFTKAVSFDFVFREFHPSLGFQYMSELRVNKGDASEYYVMLLEQKPVFASGGEILFRRQLRRLDMKPALAKELKVLPECASCMENLVEEKKFAPIERVLNRIPPRFKVTGVYNHLRNRDSQLRSGTYVFLADARGNYVCRAEECPYLSKLRKLKLKPDCNYKLGDQTEATKLADDWWSHPNAIPPEFIEIDRSGLGIKDYLSLPLSEPYGLENNLVVDEEQETTTAKRMSTGEMFMVFVSLALACGGVCCLFMIFARRDSVKERSMSSPNSTMPPSVSGRGPRPRTPRVMVATPQMPPAGGAHRQQHRRAG